MKLKNWMVVGVTFLSSFAASASENVAASAASAGVQSKKIEIKTGEYHSDGHPCFFLVSQGEDTSKLLLQVYASGEETCDYAGKVMTFETMTADPNAYYRYMDSSHRKVGSIQIINNESFIDGGKLLFIRKP